MGIVKKKFVKLYSLGTGIGVTLLLSIFILCVFSGAVVYNGANSDMNMVLIFGYLGGFIIQGAMEEIMCRGFLMNSLLHKIPRNMAILISSVMFVLPHLPTLFQFSIIIVIIGIVNLLLFSTIVSLLMIKYNNIWVACAVHSVWNFTLAIIIGINVSGSKDLLSLLNFTPNENMKLLSGGQYGIEAGIFCTIVLILFVKVLYRKVDL